MTQAESLEHLAEVVEQLVGKAEPVLGKSGQKLVSEIRKTPLIGDKYAILVNALIDRVAGLKENIHDSSSVISDVRDKVSSMVPEAPAKQDKFLKWIPGKINQYIITIKSFQTRILVCQKKIEETMQKLRSERGKSRKSEELERQLKVELTLNSQLKDEQERLKSELEEMQRSGVRTGERVGVERAEMEAMRTKLVRFSKLIAALRRQVNNSASESEVRKLIEQSGIHSDDLVESDSEIPTRLGYSESAMLAKIEKLKAKLDSVTNERDELAERLQMRNVQTSTTEHTEKIKMLSDQLKSESEELEKFKAQLSHSKSHRSTDLDSLHAKIKALHAKCKELQAQMYKLQERNQELLSERTKFETDLAKTKDSLLIARERLKAAGGDGLSLQDVGFQLAEALSEPFNPDLVDSEIPRLIKVARSQHVELSETVRTKLNPFEAPSRRSSHSSSHHSSVHSRFDDLSNQITALQTQTH